MMALYIACLFRGFVVVKDSNEPARNNFEWGVISLHKWMGVFGFAGITLNILQVIINLIPV